MNIPNSLAAYLRDSGGEEQELSLDPQLRALRGVLDREKAEIGVLITLETATRDMITEASSTGFYQSTFWQKSYPHLQILTIEELLAGASVQMPPETGTFLAAQKVKKSQCEQLGF